MSDTPKGRPRNDPGREWHGETLRLMRLQAGYSHAQVGDYCGVGRSTVQRWELSNPGQSHDEARNPPTAEQIRLVARMFGVPQNTFEKLARVST